METTNSIKRDPDKLMESTKKSLDVELSECREKLKEIQQEKRILESNEKKVEGIISGFMSTKYGRIWRIYCDHSCRHDPEYRGRFSSQDKAESFIPSYENCRISKFCRITHTLRTVDSINIDYEQWERLDTNPFYI